MNKISINQNVEVCFKIADGSEIKLSCSVKNILEDRIYLNFPAEIFSYTNYLTEGDEVNVKIFTPFGIKIFDAIILHSPLERNFVIEFVEDYIEVQRRKYLRAPLKTKIIIERANKNNIITHSLDMSAGGVRFFYEGTFAENEFVKAYLYFNKMSRSIQLRGIILKAQHLPRNEHVVLFTHIDEFEREIINKRCITLTTKDNLELAR